MKLKWPLVASTAQNMYVYIRFNGAHPDGDLACIIIPSISVFVKKNLLVLFFTTLKNETKEDEKLFTFLYLCRLDRPNERIFLSCIFSSLTGLENRIIIGEQKILEAN